MIFLTVGTQLPFKRLVGMVDEIAGARSLDVYAQTAEHDADYKNIQHSAFVNADEYDKLISKSDLIIGHAGIGTILTAIARNLPIIIVPRVAALKEHRNEHQLATAKYMQGREGIYVAETKEELEALLTRSDLQPASFETSAKKSKLISFLHDYVYEDAE